MIDRKSICLIANVDDPPMPEDLREGKAKIVFGNVENIYEWHRE